MPCKCPYCGGPHTAWDKECPGRIKAKSQAREAYQYRPRAFEPEPAVASTTTTTSQAGSIFTFARAQLQEDEEGFQRVGTKRPRLARGRPLGITVAGRDPSQTRISLGPGSLPQPTYPTPQPTQPTQLAQPTQQVEPAQPGEDIAMANKN